MGIDFGKFISAAKNAIHSSASIQGDRELIDKDKKTNENREGEIAKAMLTGLNKAAAKSVVGLDTIEFAQNKENYEKFISEAKNEAALFTDDVEILADLMGALSEIAPELDMSKIEKYNKEHPVLSEDNIFETITTSTDGGYVGLDTESFNTISKTLGESAGDVFRYMSNAIKDGSAKRISDNIEEMKKDIKGARNVMNAMSELLGNDIMSMAPSYSETKATSDKSTFDEITEFMKEDNK